MKKTCETSNRVRKTTKGNKLQIHQPGSTGADKRWVMKKLLSRKGNG